MKIFTMTKTITWNLFTGPATLMYPKRVRIFPLITRGKIVNAIDRCIFCGLCSRRCPTYAIVVSKENKEWEIDRLKCCICNLCVEVCPTKCLSTDNHYALSVTGRQLAMHREFLTDLTPPGAEAAQPGKSRGDE